MKITVFGIGYVGLSIAVLLAQQNEVLMVDIKEDKVNMINDRISPIKDDYIEQYLKKQCLNLKASLDDGINYDDSDYIVIATPTNYDSINDSFNTSTVESIIRKTIKKNPNIMIIIKSTVPIGFTKEMNCKYNSQNILFCPEFLRESAALYDNLYPSRIIIGHDIQEQELLKKAKSFVNQLIKNAIKKDVIVMYMGTREAEAVKLFSNTYLALRVSFFNELDIFAEFNELNTIDIINGVCLDRRIGDYYNNPSFGYGGYCLPKDTKQLLSHFDKIPQKIISAIVEANQTRIEYIADTIIERCYSIKDVTSPIVGIYKLAMKAHSDNYRNSAVLEIIKKIRRENFELVIFEPLVEKFETFNGIKVIKNIDEFKRISTIILANRYDKCLDDVNEKVYSRDIFGYN